MKNLFAKLKLKRILLVSGLILAAGAVGVGAKNLYLGSSGDTIHLNTHMDMNSHRLVNVDYAENEQDVATKQYVDDSFAAQLCELNTGPAPCSGDWLNCNGAEGDQYACDSDGCEVDPNTDDDNCGSCGNVCGDHSYCNGNGSCTCESGWYDCNNIGSTGGNDADGCESSDKCATLLTTVVERVDGGEVGGVSGCENMCRGLSSDYDSNLPDGYSFDNAK